MAEILIVIGGTAAGLSAASKAKRTNPDLEILVFEKSGYISYGACGLPYFVGDMIKEPDELVAVTAHVMKNKRGIPTFIHHEVTRIDPVLKTVRVKNLDDGESTVYGYDKLVIATGASPIKPDIPGIDAEGVHYLRTVEDGIRLKAAAGAHAGVPAGEDACAHVGVPAGAHRGVPAGADACAHVGVPAGADACAHVGVPAGTDAWAHGAAAKRVVIIGGGFIGLEVAEQLTLSGLEVHIYEVMPRLLPFLDETFSEMILDTLTARGVTVHTDTRAVEILTENNRTTGIRDQHGGEQPADFVLISIGVRPASQLAEQAGLELGLKGGIVVDDYMRTSHSGIWACGDCVQMKNLITGKPAYVPLGTTANKQGRIAGGNLAGEDAVFRGVLGSMVTKVFDLYIAATGMSFEQARAEGYDAAVSMVTKNDRASYYPGGRENVICLILDKKTGRLLGAQGVGSESIAGRINVFVAAITCKMTVKEVYELDLVYAPPVAPVYDPILIAAGQAMKQVGK